MNIADRIQSLRKTKGISQEELADIIGVSRQTISKWESEQSTPDMDRIIQLSDCFDVTTDFLLKGIEPIKTESEKKLDARLYTTIATVFDFIGIVVAITVWINDKSSVSVMIGLIFLAFGFMSHIIGQFIGTNTKQANKLFWIMNIWMFVLIPLSIIFNFLQGTLAGFSWYVSPLPQLGNSYLIYILFWVLYILICISVEYVIVLVFNSKNSY